MDYEVIRMGVSGIKRKKISLAVPAATYQQLQRLALESGRTVPGYVRYLIHKNLISLGLPVYLNMSADISLDPSDTKLKN